MRLLLLASAGLLLLRSMQGAPVEFVFRPSPVAENPFARELWAEVATPEGTRLLPAFYRGDGAWAVRARRASAGTYALGRVSESAGDRVSYPDTTTLGPATIEVARAEQMGGPVRIDPQRPRRFVQGDGTHFYPLGVNLPWPDAQVDPNDYYPATLAAAAQHGLNWTRVWMAHWARLNLDWRAIEDGPSPEPGSLALDVAARWDRLLEAAESTGIRVQVVLQHHGQYSSLVNSNWDINPWNAANGGFLATPTEFFTSPRARELTRRKVRYIVARWGYSPAVFAWELFNEVKWTDARAGDAAANRAVAEWHDELARYIRLLDTERHLVTTSDDTLEHPLYGAMDFLQPHLYARNMLAAVRRFELDPARLDRPIFYGEIGDDHLSGASPGVVEAGAANLPLAWAGLMSDGPYPAQLWYASRLIRSDRFGELAALSGYVRAAGLDRRVDLKAFSPAVHGRDRRPFTVEPGMHWHRMPAPRVTVPFDGRVPAELAKIPVALVWAADPKPGLEPFPSAMTLDLDYPRDATAVLRFTDAHPEGASVRVTLDDRVAAEHVWPALPEDQRENAAPRPYELVLPMKPGRRTLVIENPHGPEWVGFGGLATGLDVPILAAAGKRSDDLIVLWVYHRTGVFADAEAAPARATLELDATAPGRWRVTWWDVVTGEATASSEIEHSGGALQLETPPIARHAAVWLEKQ